jgi:thiol:disulfide interchange protein DsbC
MIMRNLLHLIHTIQREPVIMLRFILFCLLSLTFVVPASAGDPDMKQVKAGLVSAFPELSTATIKPGPISGMYEIEFDAKVFYTTSDGKYLFMGDIVDMGTHSNLTEARRASIRTRLLDEVGEQNMIVMGPANPKRTLTVFFDVDCGYCSKFHVEVPTLNKHGVKVRYLFFPRTGLHSESYKRAVAVWCSADRAKAVGIASAGGKLDMKTCTNPVEKHYLLGQRLEVNGTPTMFLDDGKMIPGYIPAPRLLSMLGIKGELSGSAVQ